MREAVRSIPAYAVKAARFLGLFMQPTVTRAGSASLMAQREGVRPCR
jgi:hypothetical protein